MNVYQFGIFMCQMERMWYIHTSTRSGDLMNAEKNEVSCLINHFKDMGYFFVPTFGDIIICADSSVVKKYQYEYLLHSQASRDMSILSCNYNFLFCYIERMMQISFSVYWKVDITREIILHMNNYWILLTKSPKLRLQERILKTSWITTLFYYHIK